MPLAYGLTESVDLPIARLPHAIERLRIAQLTDLHLTRRTKRLDRLIYQLAKLRLDLGLLTGDYIIRHRSGNQALAYLKELTQAVKPALGWYGIFGNHDRPDVIEELQSLPVTWLEDEAIALKDQPIEMIGLRCTAYQREPDGIDAAMSVADLPTTADEKDQRLRIALSHRPDFIPLCADLGADLVFCGHTHGGQVRLPFNFPLYNSSELPLHLSSGLLRHRQTLAVVSRGLGTTDLLGIPLRMRLFCPPHAPIYTLRRNPDAGSATDDISAIWRW